MEEESGGSHVISYRVTDDEYKKLEHAAKILYENRERTKLRSDSVNALCKAFMYWKINEFIQLELMTEQAALNEEKKQETAQAYS